MKRLITALFFTFALQGCSSTSVQYFNEHGEEQVFTQETFSSGTLRLAAAGYWNSGEASAWRVAFGSEEPPKGDTPESYVLKAIVQANNSNDISYYFLGWVAERQGYPEAAYEYYNLSKMLFDYRPSKNIEGIWDKALFNGDEVIVSLCGYRKRQWQLEGVPCIKDMRQVLSQSIKRIEENAL